MQSPTPWAPRACQQGVRVRVRLANQKARKVTSPIMSKRLGRWEKASSASPRISRGSP
ncbi:hypothetical protein MF133_22645 [Aeromonas caviae]|uniref:hypothetical protein n=1 Tax=Aeromonas caviae TaxID=648 RepID=UPI001EF15F12|nr:hypothetical protein [Aeromonas caviae]ULH02857.1 hypothetical protein MF133_22645 [Aeromonas caviae]